MALETQYFQVLLNKGVDQKTDPKLVQEGLLKLENGVYRDTPGQTPGGQKVTMAYGYQNLGNKVSSSTGDTSLTGGEALGVFQDELLLFNKNKIYSRAEFNDSYVDKGSVVPLNVSSKALIRNSASQTKGDFDTLNGVSVCAWVDSRGGVRASVFDSETGNMFQTDVQISSVGDYPRVRAVGSYIFVFYVDTSANAIKFKRLQLSNPFSFLAEQTLISSTNVTSRWYDCQVYGNNIVWVAYLASNTSQLGYVDQSGSTVAGGLPSSVNIGETAQNCLSLFVRSDGFIYVLFHNNTNGTRITGYTANLGSPSFAPTTINSATSPITLNITMAEAFDGTPDKIFYEQNATNTYDHLIRRATVTRGGSVSSDAVLIRSVGLCSKAFTQDGMQYVNAHYQGTASSSTFTEQSTYFTINYSGTIVSKIAPYLASSLVQGYLPQAVNLGSSVWGFTNTRKTQFVSSVSSLMGIFQTNLDFGTFDRYYSAALGKNLHISGGFLSQYDGGSVVEHGFHLYPEPPSPSISASGGSLGIGTYYLAVVYEWVDAYGQRHQSAPTFFSHSFGSGTTNQFTSISIPTLRLTSKTSPRSEVMCTLYMTQLNGTVYYKVSNTPLYNSTASDSVTSAAITNPPATTNEILYTTGGVLENIPPPAVQYVVANKNRVFVSNAEDSNEIWFSKSFTPNEGVAFNDSLIFRLDPLGGDLKGMYPMDDKIIFFKENHMYFLSGDGPTNSGLQNTFTDPQLIASDVGLKDSNSIVLTDQGLMFNSNKGKYLLGRSLELQYIGGGVEALNNLTCTSADLIPSQNQVRFIHSDGSTAIYDTYYKTWTTRSNHSGQDAVIWNNAYHYLRNDNGYVYQETPDFYFDDNKSITLTVETPWIKLSALQNFQRIKRVHVLGDFYSYHKLKLEIGYDYNEGIYPDVLYFDPDDVIQSSVYGTGTYGTEAVYSGVEDGVYQVRFHVPNQKCSAIKFKLSNVSTSGTGKAMGLTALQLECGMKSGQSKLRADKSA